MSDKELETLLHVALSVGDLEQAAKIGAEIDAVSPAPAVSMLSAALWYGQQGIPVFPCRPFDKAPRTSHGVKDATTDEAAIRAWWEAVPNGNVALATGQAFDVLDIDSWANVNETIEAIIEEGFGFVSTPRGGAHVYLPASGDGNATNLVDGVDFRGIGGYVLAPPSVLPNGHYRWLEPVNFQGVTS